ncbi:MAG: TIGR00266 family protein, partial [Deltaproteobacteria bacterium]|nr:TIGR00266 family protein [Deltaproteobacteria bacterium]
MSTPTSHVVDHKIYGDDLQFVEIELDPQETVIAEAGSMVYMNEGIVFEAKFGDGSQIDQGFWGKAGQAVKRKLTGESLFMTHFTNQSQGKKVVSFGAPYPGKIVPLALSQYANGEVLCQKDAFLCAAKGTQVSIAFQKKLGAGFFGGEGFILQKLKGDGNAYLHAGGSIVEKHLRNEKIMIDTGCVVAFESSLHYDIERAGSLKSMIFGGEGIFLATLQGTGRVWI